MLLRGRRVQRGSEEQKGRSRLREKFPESGIGRNALLMGAQK
jgi:hypothetical protein